ncbi:MAG: tetratricopeptide repeat protein [Actinobacteria bacterium]|nr:tetratricopeptide repeat protein [Actinomycetota bacterium]
MMAELDQPAPLETKPPSVRENQGGSGLAPSFAESLVEAGAPVVLGWGQPVGDHAATVLAGVLYEQLGTGERLDVAIARARTALHEEGSSYWHLLRAYADASPLGPLVTSRAEPGRERLRIRQVDLDFLDPADPAKTRVCPQSRFVGRRRVVQECLRTLRVAQQTEAAYREGMVLYGMGGLGKSSLAARLCARLSGHRRLVWVGQVDEGELLRLAGDRLGPDASRILNESDAGDLRQRLRALLARIDDPILFVLDDFEHNMETNLDGSPRLGADGRGTLWPDALTVLGGLLWAIRETGSDSRVIVTSRYRFVVPAGTGRLAEVSLEGLTGPDLTKKAGQLLTLSAPSMPTSHRSRVLELADGNPRLLEWCDRALATTGLDPNAVMDRLAAVASEFREHVLVDALLDQLPPACRALLARLSVCRLPVDSGAVAATVVHGSADIAPCIARAVSAGLVEEGRDASTNEPRYRVPQVVAAIVETALTTRERNDSIAAALDYLYKRWWVEGGYIKESEALELHRLATAATNTFLASEMARFLAFSWFGKSRYREAARLCEETRESGLADAAVLHQLGQALDALGDTGLALDRYDEALALCPADRQGILAAILHSAAIAHAQRGRGELALELFERALAIEEQIGADGQRAVTLHHLARLYADRGDQTRALTLYEEALGLETQVGAVESRAATLHMIAIILHDQGDTERAMELLRESLAIKEDIGDARGKANTIHEMARIHADDRSYDIAMSLLKESLAIKEHIGDSRGAASTLHEMGRIHMELEEYDEALALSNQSLAVAERIGHERDRAVTLGQMAGIYTDLGDFDLALDLSNRSIEIIERCGYTRHLPSALDRKATILRASGQIEEAIELYGASIALDEELGNRSLKAATLARLAGALDEVGRLSAAREAYGEACATFMAIRDYVSLLSVLLTLGARQQDDTSILAQAVWLTLTVRVTAPQVVESAVYLADCLGPEDSVSLLAVVHAIQHTTAIDEDRYRKLGGGHLDRIMASCLEGARGLSVETAPAWLQAQGLTDPNIVAIRLRVALERMVSESQWMFDRDSL